MTRGRDEMADENQSDAIEGRVFIWRQIGIMRNYELACEGESIVKIGPKGGWKNLNTFTARIGERKVDIVMSSISEKDYDFIDCASSMVIASMRPPRPPSVTAWISGNAYNVETSHKGFVFEAIESPEMKRRVILEMKYRNYHGSWWPTGENEVDDVRGKEIAQLRFANRKRDDPDPWLMATIALIYCVQHPFTTSYGI
jgi:hypothetical protein